VGLALPAPTPAQEASPPAAWSWPEQAENLQELPADFSGARLRSVMTGFTRSLGVRCSHCHVGSDGEPLSTFDFASDANPTKETAREMLRMLGSINQHLAKIEPSGEKVNMWCHTCHRGQPRPQTLAEALGETYRQQGVDAMVARYGELRESGAGAFDFSEASLNLLGYGLLGSDDTEAAIAAFRLNVERHPDSANAWDSLAEAYLAADRPELARIHYEKSLQLDPGNANALAKLQKIRTAPSGGAATPPGRSSG